MIYCSWGGIRVHRPRSDINNVCESIQLTVRLTNNSVCSLARDLYFEIQVVRGIQHSSTAVASQVSYLMFTIYDSCAGFAHARFLSHVLQTLPRLVQVRKGGSLSCPQLRILRIWLQLSSSVHFSVSNESVRGRQPHAQTNRIYMFVSHDKWTIRSLMSDKTIIVWLRSVRRFVFYDFNISTIL